MAKLRRKIHSFDIFSGHAWYVPGVGGIFSLLLLLLAGVALGSLVTVIITFSLGAQAALEYGMLISYPLMFVPPMIYVGVKSRRNMLFEPGYALDSNHFGKSGGALLALLCAIAVLAAAFMTDFFNSLMPPMPDFLADALKSMTSGELWVDLLCVAVFAPVFEEWLCRGMVLRGLLNAKKEDGSRVSSPAWAIVISALFFALIHANPWQAIPAFVLGCLFGYVYYRTGSLKLTMLMHCVNNAFAVICSRIDAFSEMDNWVDIFPRTQYWILFAACAMLLILIVRVFDRIPLSSPSGNCDPVTEDTVTE